ncbi:MAG: hypothetical protein JST82_07145 [Bacteroidetes bacterium]|nr:hypothetical protein [Bacteroidota bacterium]
MKYVHLTLLLAVLMIGCRKRDCINATVTDNFIGYSRQELADVVYLKYNKGTEFTNAVDSYLAGTNRGVSGPWYDKDTISFASGIMDMDHDWIIDIRSANKQYRISNFIIEKRSVRGSFSMDAKACYNPAKQCRINESVYVLDDGTSPDIMDRYWIYLRK